jgi:hypothetical protein
MEPSPELLRGPGTVIRRPPTRVGSFILERQPLPSRINLVSTERAEPDQHARKIHQEPARRRSGLA